MRRSITLALWEYDSRNVMFKAMELMWAFQVQAGFGGITWLDWK